MKGKLVLIVCILLLLGCREAGKPASYIRSTLEPLDIDKTKNILIYTINPNDCISCIIGFKSINDALAELPNSRVFIISVDREVEKNELLKKITSINLKPSKNQSVLWSTDAFKGVNRSVKNELPLSMVLVYNYENDSVLFSKPVREISSEKELLDEL